MQWAELFGCPTPTEIYRSVWDESLTRDLAVDTEKSEGYVVRLTDAYHFNQFALSLAKWVRPKYVQTDQHWMHAQIIPNGLKEKDDA